MARNAKYKMCVAGALSVAVASSLMQPVHAQVPLPAMVVIDPAAIAKIVVEIGQIASLINESVQIYNTAVSSLAAFNQNRTPLSVKSWTTYTRSLGNNTTVNTFGETSGVQGALNTATGIVAVWGRVAASPLNMTTFYSGASSANPVHMNNLATVEMHDSAAQTTMSVLGNYRVNDLKNQPGFTQLDADVQNTSAAFNTEAAQLNLANAIAMQNLKQQRSMTAVNAALLEQQLAANKYQRDAVVAHMNLFSAVNQRQATSRAWMLDGTGSAQTAANWLVP